VASLYGVNGDGAVYYDDGSGLIWIPTADAFNAMGFNWADISWGDYLPYPAQDPYQASDNPPGASAPPPQENPVGGNPPPDQPEPEPPATPPASTPPVATTPSSGSSGGDNGGEPILALVGPASVVAGYSITPQGQVVYNAIAPPGSIPGPIDLAAGYTIYDVDGQAMVGPVGGDPFALPPDPTTIPLDPTVYGIRQPGGSGTTLAPTFNGKITAQGQHTLLLSAMQNEGQNGILTAQVIANTMGNAVV
jgi:hypothetical protein